MSTYIATTTWDRDSQDFTDNRYSRAHTWTFDGGVTVPASSSPHIVPLPMSAENAVDPEEAFIASLSSCHLLWFLHVARSQGYIVDHYVDETRGVLGKNADGKLAIISVELRPRVTFGGEHQPDRSTLDALHHTAHEQCFIANSVRSEVICSPVYDD